MRPRRGRGCLVGAWAHQARHRYHQRGYRPRCGRRAGHAHGNQRASRLHDCRVESGRDDHHVREPESDGGDERKRQDNGGPAGDAQLPLPGVLRRLLGRLGTLRALPRFGAVEPTALPHVLACIWGSAPHRLSWVMRISVHMPGLGGELLAVAAPLGLGGV